jgi:hypothetical protein
VEWLEWNALDELGWCWGYGECAGETIDGLYWLLDGNQDWCSSDAEDILCPGDTIPNCASLFRFLIKFITLKNRDL